MRGGSYSFFQTPASAQSGQGNPQISDGSYHQGYTAVYRGHPLVGTQPPSYTKASLAVNTDLQCIHGHGGNNPPTMTATSSGLVFRKHTLSSSTTNTSKLVSVRLPIINAMAPPRVLFLDNTMMSLSSCNDPQVQRTMTLSNNNRGSARPITESPCPRPRLILSGFFNDQMADGTAILMTYVSPTSPRLTNNLLGSERLATLDVAKVSTVSTVYCQCPLPSLEISEPHMQ